MSDWYSGPVPTPKGDPKSYDMAAEIFDGIKVEDWGCGEGYFKYLYGTSTLSVDDKDGAWTDKAVNFSSYTSQTPGILLRHMIEHRYDFRSIMANANKSFTEVLVLILFTPMDRKTRELAWNSGEGLPLISFSHADVRSFFPECRVTWKDIRSNTQFGHERVYTVRRG